MSNVIIALQAVLRQKKTPSTIGTVIAVGDNAITVSTADGVIESITGGVSYIAGESVLVSAGTVVGRVETESSDVWID